jgi:hypothetical protein
MKQPMTVVVRGKHHTWAFSFKGDPAHLPDWIGDGLDVTVIEGTIPAWMAGTPLMHPWLWLQVAWRWLRVW